MLLTLPILIHSIFTQSSSNTVKETFCFRNILFETQQHFLYNSLGNKVDRQPPWNNLNFIMLTENLDTF